MSAGNERVSNQRNDPGDWLQLDLEDEKRRWWLFAGSSNQYRRFRHSADEDDPQVIKGLILQKDA